MDVFKGVPATHTTIMNGPVREGDYLKVETFSDVGRVGKIKIEINELYSQLRNGLVEISEINKNGHFVVTIETEAQIRKRWWEDFKAQRRKRRREEAKRWWEEAKRWLWEDFKAQRRKRRREEAKRWWWEDFEAQRRKRWWEEAKRWWWEETKKDWEETKRWWEETKKVWEETKRWWEETTRWWEENERHEEEADLLDLELDDLPDVNVHYYILGVDKLASQREIKLAYINRSRKYHPDKNPNRSLKATKI